MWGRDVSELRFRLFTAGLRTTRRYIDASRLRNIDVIYCYFDVNDAFYFVITVTLKTSCMLSFVPQYNS